MPKIFIKNKRKKEYKKYTNWWHFGAISVLVLMMGIFLIPSGRASAADCKDIKIIFARGSGEKRFEDQNYLTFKKTLIDKLALTHLNYEFLDLDYPAISVADASILISTFVSGGEAYEFGESINAGVETLQREINGSECSNTQYVLAGYSQGAMVVSKALRYLNPDKIIYAATFGDPKLYLPEGKGLVPAACKGKNLSNYRIYVPDCRAYSGMLGGYNPYQTAEYIDKLGTWCNKKDFFCSSYLSMTDHTSYVKDGIYAEASKIIFDKIVSAFDIENRYISMHDTVILIDSTGSMSDLIDKYKAEALTLAQQTLENGGRVALYDYRDISDSYPPNERCNFETCTLESFKAGLDAIEADGGGDTPESLLSASLHVMKKLNWHYGATKSVVVLTDANYHSPDLDGVTFDEVVALSKKIDPVNFYIITPDSYMYEYASLASATDGAVVSSASDLSILTQNIIERYDSLPRVEESLEIVESVPGISTFSFEWIDDTTASISWVGGSGRTLVILNDYILGMSESNSVTLIGLNRNTINLVRLVPIGENARGEGVEIKINEVDPDFEMGDLVVEMLIPKAPNTGKLF